MEAGKKETQNRRFRSLLFKIAEEGFLE